MQLTEHGDCTLFGDSFGWFIQVVIGVLCFLTLLCKVFPNDTS